MDTWGVQESLRCCPNTQVSGGDGHKPATLSNKDCVLGQRSSTRTKLGEGRARVDRRVT